MKPGSFRLYLASLLLTAGAPAVLAEPSTYTTPVSRAVVSLSESELKEFLAKPSASPAPTPTPPVQSLLSAADYELKLGNPPEAGQAAAEGVELVAILDAQNLVDGQSSVACADATLPLESVQPADATLFPQNSALHLVMPKAGQSQVTLRFRLNGDAASGLVIPLIPSVRGTLRITGAKPGTLYRVTAGRIFHISAPGKIVLPPNCGQISVAEVTETSQKSASWDSFAEGLALKEDAQLQILCRLLLSATVGERSKVELALPDQARDVSVEGKAMEGWNVVSAETGRQLRVSWKDATQPDRELHVRYNLPVRALSEDISVALPSPVRKGKTGEQLIVGTPPGTEPGGEGLEPHLDAGQLPGWMRKEAEGFRLGAFRGASPWQLRFRELERIAADEPVILSAEHRTRYAIEGTALTESLFKIEHREPFSWKVKLPAGSKILRCSLDGKPAAPLKREDAGTFEIPLDGKGAAREVRVTYILGSPKFDPVKGTIESELPVTPLFIRQTEWKLELPANFTAEVGGQFPGDPRSRSRRQREARQDPLTRGGGHVRRDQLPPRRPRSTINHPPPRLL